MSEGLVREGTSGNDTLEGSAYGDTFIASAGDDLLLGMGGVDTAEYASGSFLFTWTRDGDAWEVYDAIGPRFGDDRLESVERLRFSDRSIALDIDAHACTVAKTLGAVFGAEAVANADYAGIGLMLLDGGMEASALMQLALDVQLGAGASHEEVVALLHENVLGRLPTSEEAAPFIQLLDSGMLTPAALGLIAAGTSFNLANIDMVGLQAHGLAYHEQA